jgi:hypothetical protein
MQSNPGRGARIGLLGGILYVPFLFASMAICSVLRPDVHQSSTSVMAVYCCIPFSVFGFFGGAVGGAICDRLGLQIRGALRGGIFGVVLLGALEALQVISLFAGNPERALAVAGVFLTQSLVSSCLSGALAGAIIGSQSKK